MVGRRVDDRSTKARIRDAAIECLARYGVHDMTARRVAETAGVSPALVIHHFGSMEGLRSACDEYVIAAIKRRKKDAAAAGLGLDLLGALRDESVPSLLGYLAAVLVEESPAVERLVDQLAADVEEYSADFVEAGVLSPSRYPRERAALLLIWSLGSLVLRKHLKRLVGVDLEAADMAATPGFARYALATYEIYGNGILTREAMERLTTATGELDDGPMSPDAPEWEES